MYINNSKTEIILTKAEYTKAMKIGTKEFEELFKAKQMFPYAKISIKKSDNKQGYKNLTKKFMLGYVELKDKDYYEEFKKLFDSIGEPYIDDENGDIKTVSFFLIRDKFLNKYPQFMTETDRKKYEESKKSKESEENTSNVVLEQVA